MGLLERLRCKSAVYGLNGRRSYYIISLFKVTYKSTIQVSRNFHALFTKTLENFDVGQTVQLASHEIHHVVGVALGANARQIPAPGRCA